MKASDGERTRLEHAIKNLRGLIDGLEMTLATPGGVPATESALSVVDAAARVATTTARYDTHLRADEQIDDLQESLDSVCERCQDKCKHKEPT